MAKFNISETVYLIRTREETKIKKVIMNHAKRTVVYVLENGLRVSSDDITKDKPVREKRKYTKKENKIIEDLSVPDVSFENMDKSPTIND